jgi:hypothetical protein
METTQSNIFLHCYDEIIIDPIPGIGNLVDLAHKNNTVNVHLDPESPDLALLTIKGTKLIDFLGDLCGKNKWKKDKFRFVTGNIIQEQVWPHIQIEPSWTAFLSIKPTKQNTMSKLKKIGKKFGCYVVNSSWPRLWLSAYLHQYHKEYTDQTFLRDPEYPGHAINLDLDALCFKFSSTKDFGNLDLLMIFKFLKNIPLIKPGTEWDGRETFDSIHKKKEAISDTIMNWYNNIFVDIVCETFFSGNTFRPTEKTARSLATMTPFIMMASPHTLTNLRKIGFKTFSKYWDESYDYLEGSRRILAIKELIEDISQKTTTELEQIIVDMEPILKHNQQLYFYLNKNKLDAIFKL